MAGCCKYGNEHSGSTKCRNFLDQLRNDWLLKTDDSAVWRRSAVRYSQDNPSSRWYRVQSSVMLLQVSWKIGKEVSRKLKEICTSWHWKWKHHYPSTSRHGVSTRSTWIFNNTAVETSNLTHPYVRARAVWEVQAATSYGSSWVGFYFHVMTKTEPASKTLAVLIRQNRYDKHCPIHVSFTEQ